MKNKILILMLALCLVMPMISAEISCSSQIIIDNSSSTMDKRTICILSDTSPDGSGGFNLIPVGFLGFSDSSFPNDYGNLIVENCTYSFFHSIMNSNVSISTIISAFENPVSTLYYFSPDNINGSFTFTTDAVQNTGNAGIVVYAMANDIIQVDMTCKYNQSQNIYQYPLFAYYTIAMPSYECRGCQGKSYAELSTTNQTLESFYDKIQTGITLDYQIWLIFSWILKIAFYLIGIGLIFYGIYFVYVFIKKIEGAIR